jgi:hypothetical protein
MNTTQTRIQIFFAILVWCAGGLTSVRAQSFWNDLTISVELAAAQHDIRNSKRKIIHSIAESPWDTQGRWGTWQYGISVRKHILDWRNISLEAGLGYSLEHLTYLRQINYCFFYGDACPYIGAHSDNYKVHLAEIPVTVTYPVVGNLKAELSVLPLFDIYKTVRSPLGKLIGEKKTIDFYSLEINPGIRYQKDRIVLSMNYRLYQVKKIDRVIFNESKEKLEDYNPLKFWFSVGYRLGNAE